MRKKYTPKSVTYEYNIWMDGNAWMATRSDFIDGQENPAGFGKTPGLALRALFKDIKKEQGK